MPVQPLQSSERSTHKTVTRFDSGSASFFFNSFGRFYAAVIVTGPSCPPPPISPFVCLQVCHHPDCLDLNSKSPLHLCESCDSRCHSENSDNMHFDRHPRFDLQPQGRVAVCRLFSRREIKSCHGFIYISWSLHIKQLKLQYQLNSYLEISMKKLNEYCRFVGLFRMLIVDQGREQAVQ